MKKFIAIALFLSACGNDPNTVNTLASIANAALAPQPQPTYNVPTGGQNNDQHLMNLVNALGGLNQQNQAAPTNYVAPNVPQNATYVPANATLVPAQNGGYYVIQK